MTAGKVGLVVITLERYFKIVHAIAHRKYYRNWMTSVGVVLPWIIGVCLILFPSIAVIRIVNGQCIISGVWPNEATETVRLYSYTFRFAQIIHVYMQCVMLVVIYFVIVIIRAKQNFSFLLLCTTEYEQQRSRNSVDLGNWEDLGRLRICR